MCSWKEDFCFHFGLVLHKCRSPSKCGGVCGRRTKKIPNNQKKNELHDYFDGNPLIIPQRPAWCSTYSSKHVQNMPILTNPLVQHSFLIIILWFFSKKFCESLPSHSPDERIFFNLMNLICEIKEMSLIKWHYAEGGRFALKIFSLEEFHYKMTSSLDWKLFGAQPCVCPC